MAKTIPQSLKDMIDENPEHYIDYLNLEKIFSAKNPYREFLNQFQKAFGHKQGLNLWQYVMDRYALLNELYKNETIQEGLDDEFKGSLNKNETKKYFEDYNKKISKIQKIKQKKIEKPISVPSHTRAGKRISAYKSSIKHKYNEREIRFILTRKKDPIKRLTDEFNRAFETSVSMYGIRDKKLRILGRKK